MCAGQKYEGYDYDVCRAELDAFIEGVGERWWCVGKLCVLNYFIWCYLVELCDNV